MKHVLCYWPYYTPKPTTPEKKHSASQAIKQPYIRSIKSREIKM
jgi:hypothetical protein